METKDNAAELAFVECVRRQSLQIATLIQSGKTQAAAEAALALCSQTARRKREVRGMPEPLAVDVDHDQEIYDLSVFNSEYTAPEAAGDAHGSVRHMRGEE